MSATSIAPAATSPAAYLKEQFHKLKRSRIRVHPAHTSRASSIGHECERYLTYERTSGELRKVHDEGLQALFDLGNADERFVIAELAAMGIDVFERSRDYHDRELELTGHIDGALGAAAWGDETVPAEIKSLNPFTAESIDSIDDIRNSRQGWVRKYYAQLQTYLWFAKKPRGVFVLLNKVSGEITFIDCPADPEFQAEVIEKVKRIRDHVRAKTLPERHQTSECARCAFAHVCLPDLHFGDAVRVDDAPELIAALAKRESLRDAHREYSAADRAVKQYLPEKAGELLVGPYAVVGKEQHRKGFTVAPTSFVKWEVRLVNPSAAPTPAPPKPELVEQLKASIAAVKDEDAF